MSYFQSDNLSKEDLLKDEEFLSDAQEYLVKRTDTFYGSPEEIYNAWVEQNRVVNVNEVSAIKDYNYATSKDRTEEEKDQMGRLYLAYDRLGNADTGTVDKILDYGEGIVTAPSTWLGLISGGVSKAAGLGGTRAAIQLAKAAATGRLKSKLSQGVAAGLRTAAVEGGIEAGAETTRQLARVESGAQEDVSVGQVALSAGLAGGSAGVLSGVLAGAGRGAQREAAAELYRAGLTAKTTRETAANTKAEKTLDDASNKEIYDAIKLSSSTLDELDKARVARGKEKIKEIAVDATDVTSGVRLVEDTTDDFLSDFGVRVPVERLDRITAATVDAVKAVGLDANQIKGKRITDILADVVQKEGGEKAYKDLLKQYELNFEDVAAMFAFEFSEAGKVLAVASTAKRNLNSFFQKVSDMSTKIGDEAPELTKRNAEADNVNKKHSATWQAIKNIDSARRGLMTVQPATTVRNTANAGLRTFLHAVENIGEGIVQIGTGKFKEGVSNIASPVSLFRYLVGNTEEARIIQALSAEAAPEQMQSLFRSLADVSLKASDEELLAQKGFTGALIKGTRYANALNTLSDNTFKRAIFTSELAKSVGGYKNLQKIIADGRFSDISGEAFERATKSALDLTYQKGYDHGTFANGFIKTFSQPGLSLLIPFPRFVANSMQFAFEHAPLMGMFDLSPVFGKTERSIQKRIAQQITGVGMLAGAIQLRAAMGDDTKWYELQNSRGELFDGKALYGPFAPYMVIADTMVRGYNRAATTGKRVGTEDLLDPKVWKETLSEIQGSKVGTELIKASLGTTFKTGVNLSLIDTATREAIETGDVKSVNKLLVDMAANLVNSFTVGAGVAKDVLGTFDEDYLNIPDTQDVNLWERFIKRSLRSIPQAPMEGQRIISPTRTDDPVRGAIPLLKQVTGLTPVAARNTVERELVKLNIEPYEFFKLRYSDPKLRKAMNEMYGMISEEALIPAINSRIYNRTEDGFPTSVSEKKRFLTDILETKKTVSGVNYTDEEYLLTWIQKGDNTFTDEEKEELTSSLYSEMLRRQPKTTINAARSFYNRKHQDIFDDLPNNMKIDYVKQYAKQRKLVFK
jgi:hypothetical protein